MTIEEGRSRAQSAPRKSDTRAFPARTFKGSRLRCLLATGMSDHDSVAFLNKLIYPHATVAPSDTWMPRGFLGPDEACLGDTTSLLGPEQRDELAGWWLAKRERANTPNWDLVSSCQVQGRAGLVLVEAKAHASELHSTGLAASNAANAASIRQAITDANSALGGAAAGWALTADKNYQLCNRFAWAWKLADMGIPTVLVYLGFLGANEMGSRAFATSAAWRQALLDHAQGVVPSDVWDRAHAVSKAWMVPLIRSARVEISVST
jgi:hypothetical protein